MELAEVPAANAAANPDRFDHEKLALHHRDPPETLSRDHLAGLEAVAEVAQAGAQRNRPLGTGQPIEARRGRAGQDALANTLDDPLADALAIHREQQHGG